jgi:hypothetical protein
VALACACFVNCCLVGGYVFLVCVVRLRLRCGWCMARVECCLVAAYITGEWDIPGKRDLVV